MYAGSKLVPIADVQSTCNETLLTIRLNERSGIPEHSNHAVNNKPRRVHHLHAFKNCKMSKHERNAVHEVVTFRVCIARLFLYLDNKGKEDKGGGDKGKGSSEV